MPCRILSLPLLGIRRRPPLLLPTCTPPPPTANQSIPMCKSRKVTMASDPKPKPRPSPRASRSSDTMPSSFAAMTESSITTGALTSTSFSCDSLASVRDSLREVPLLYPFPEICSATNNFLSRRLSSSSSAWRCTLRGADAVVLQRTLRGDPSAVPARLSALCRSHHTSVARLLGASLTGDGRIYIAYEHVAGATLADCLRNPRNPGFTPLSSWISRMQVAADLAQGLEYIHHHSSFSSSPTPAPCRRGTVHNRIKSSGVIVTEPGFRAKICHLGAAELAGDLPASADDEKGEEICIPRGISDEFSASPAKTRRSDSSGARIEGTRGYIAPEVLAGRRISQSSDVFGFGVVLLELLSGDEPLRYRLEKGRIERVSLIETAMEAHGPAAAGEDEEGEAATGVTEERRGRIRRWVDRRLRDSFPIEVAEKLIRLALRCVEAEAAMRPDMVWVAGKVSRLFLESLLWEERVGLTPDMSVSLAPR